MKINQIDGSYHKVQIVEVLVPFDIDIKLCLSAASRNDCSYYFDDEKSESIFEGRTIYAVGNQGFHIHIIDELIPAFQFHGWTPTHNELMSILGLIKQGFIKCESRYGNSVSDWDLHEADALIHFKSDKE